MNLSHEQNWREAFTLAAAAKAAKRQDERMVMFNEEMDREKDKQQENKKRQAEELKNLEDIAATTAQLAEFSTRLDTYDGKTVEALMENREALDRVRDEMRRMSGDAYVLPDGRHVFKTVNGRQVFDERGAEVPLNIIDPETIGDHHPHWESFKAVKESEGKLLVEQDALIHFQAKIDEVRSQTGHGDMSKKQLDDLDADLKANMPTSVRQQLGLANEAGDAMHMRSEGKALANPPSITDETARRLQAAPVPR